MNKEIKVKSGARKSTSSKEVQSVIQALVWFCCSARPCRCVSDATTVMPPPFWHAQSHRISLDLQSLDYTALRGNTSLKSVNTGVQVLATLMSSSTCVNSSGSGTLVFADDLSVLHSPGVKSSTLVPIAFTWLHPNGKHVVTDEMQNLLSYKPPYAAIVVVADPAKSRSELRGEQLSILFNLNAAAAACNAPPCFVCSPANMGSLVSCARKRCTVTFEMEICSNSKL